MKGARQRAVVQRRLSPLGALLEECSNGQEEMTQQDGQESRTVILSSSTRRDCPELEFCSDLSDKMHPVAYMQRDACSHPTRKSRGTFVK